jgi:hypothetical protein
MARKSAIESCTAYTLACDVPASNLISPLRSSAARRTSAVTPPSSVIVHASADPRW